MTPETYSTWDTTWTLHMRQKQLLILTLLSTPETHCYIDSAIHTWDTFSACAIVHFSVKCVELVRHISHWKVSRCPTQDVSNMWHSSWNVSNMWHNLWNVSPCSTQDVSNMWHNLWNVSNMWRNLDFAHETHEDIAHATHQDVDINSALTLTLKDDFDIDSALTLTLKNDFDIHSAMTLTLTLR